MERRDAEGANAGRTRRRLLTALGSAGVVGLAGCSGENGEGAEATTTTDDGVDTMTQNGFQMVSPVVVPENAKSTVPSDVMKGAKTQRTLGPLEL